MTLLRVEEIRKHFGNLVVLDGVTFSVNEGEILGIAGPNGAGKTTLFNVISGFQRLTSGTIFFGDRNISNLKPHQVCALGIARTFQIPTVLNTLTVRDNVKVGAIFGNKEISEKEIKAYVEEILVLTKLEKVQNIVAGTLNLFQKKLLMLAAAYATNPKLILLDEPAAGLPQAETKPFFEIVSKINLEFNKTIIIIEHLIDWLRFISKKMLILHNGKIMTHGLPADVVKDDSVIEIYLGRSKDGA